MLEIHELFPKPLIKEKKKNYIDNKEFLKELLLCQGTGKVSDELWLNMQLITNNLYNRIQSGWQNVRQEDVDDAKQSVMLHLILKYKSFNYKKFDNPLAYFTELAKRCYAQHYTIIMTRKSCNMSINNMYSIENNRQHIKDK